MSTLDCYVTWSGFATLSMLLLARWEAAKTTVTIQPNEAQSTGAAPRKLSYKAQRALETQKRELAALPQRIETLEAEQQRITAAMAAPAFYQRDNAEIAKAAKRLKQLEEQLAQAYQRWEELEQL